MSFRSYRLRDLAERLFWTIVAAATSSIVAAGAFDVDVWAAAGIAGGTAAVNYILIIGRWRLSALPDPGDGLPGLPT